MNSLFIDTHGKCVTVILFKDGKVIDQINLETMNKHSVVAMPSIKSILENNGCSINDIHEILVCNGPGSFTGIRIGAGIAKGFCAALPKIKRVPINSLDLIAYTFAKTNPSFKQS